jgi:hypothetical protein
MLFGFLDRWRGIPKGSDVAARLRIPAFNPDDQFPEREAFREQREEEGSKSWVWEAKFSLTKKVVASSGTLNRACPRQNREMAQILSHEELDVLKVLNEAFPDKLHLDEAAGRLGLDPHSPQLLRTAERLLERGFVTGKTLRGSEGLAAVANLQITETGLAALGERTAEKAATPLRAPLKSVQASVLNVLIASPSDVGLERDAVVSAIQEWNSSHFARTGIMLNAVRWETHAYPSAGDRPQGLLNKQIVESAHFLIAIFGSRLGTPTGQAESGTIEEIEQFRATGRHVALYFSNAQIARSVDRAQLAALETYQSERQRDSLYFTYASAEELRRLVTQHLPKIVAEVDEAIRVGPTVGAVEPEITRTKPARSRRNRSGARAMSIEDIGDLNAKEIELLWNAAKDADGDLLHSETFEGEGIRTNEKHFLEGTDRRTEAEWLTALSSLESRGLIQPLSDERDFFKLTGEGYAVADELEEFASWNTSSINLHAYYMNADSEELTLTCKRVIAIPATYYADQVGADRSVMRSVKERRSLLVEGVSSKPAISWTPTDVDFTDAESGRTESFRVDGMDFLRPGAVRLAITG